MSEPTAVLEPQFDRLEQQHEATNIGMWAFLATEVLFFGTLFTAYATYRMLYPEAFHEGSRLLVWPAGAINTAVLLTSSFTMALAVRATRTGGRTATIGFLLATVFFGALFLGIKGWEYWDEVHKGHVPAGLLGMRGHGGPPSTRTELFLSFYFIMTGLHALHMVVGLGLLLWMAWKAWRVEALVEAGGPVEMTGLYWHFVDVVWIFLFPMLYLLGLD